MESKNKINSGAIFKNAKKTNEKQPDYQGTVNINGKDMQVSLWVKESKNGNKYFSASFKEPYKKDSETKTYPNETKYTPNIIDDQLPF